MNFKYDTNQEKLIVSKSTRVEYHQVKIWLTRKIKGWRFLPAVKMGVWNGDVSHFKTGGYTAIIAGRYTSGRNFEAKGKTWPGVRVLIMPLVVIGGNSKEI
jgi:hypothetical protein